MPGLCQEAVASHVSIKTGLAFSHPAPVISPTHEGVLKSFSNRRSEAEATHTQLHTDAEGNGPGGAEATPQ